MRHTTTAPSPPPSLFAICAQENSKVSPLYPLVFSCGKQLLFVTEEVFLFFCKVS